MATTASACGSTSNHAAARSAANASSQGSGQLTGHAIRLRKTGYETTMQVMGRTLGTSVDRLYPLDTGVRGSATANSTIARLHRTSGVVSAILAKLVRIVPPTAVAVAQRNLETGLRALNGQIAKLITSLQKGDVSGFTALSGLPSLALIAKATSAMQKQGYNVLGKK